jgi:hypothetical protein
MAFSVLALTLLVPRVALADDHDAAVATDHLAVVADGLDAGVDLHVLLLSLSSYRDRILSDTAQPLLLGPKTRSRVYL